jgi:hypothetical protein
MNAEALPGGGDLAMVYTTSFANCLAACASTSGCVDVSWVPGSPQGPCYMKNSVNAASSNQGVWGARILGSISSMSASLTSMTPSSTGASSASSTGMTTSILTTPSSSSGCGKALPAGQSDGGSSTTVSFTQSDGTVRSYLIHIPANYSSTSLTPLIFSFHGASSTSANQEGLTGFSGSTVNPNAIVVYPQGINVGSSRFLNATIY